MPIVDDETKRKLRRRFIKRRKKAQQFGQQADKNIDNLLIKRFDRLVSVRRFVGLWLCLFVLLFFATLVQLRALSNYYQSLQPVSGGLYSEGSIGSFTNANPLYADGAANVAVSRLVFSGLFKYGTNNNLVGDLATGWTLNDAQTVYTVKLRHNVTWQDGKPFNADDVLFTYHTIQNIEAQSSLYSSWQGITVSKIDPYTVSFTLPNSLSAFPYSLTNGIVPQHLLGSVPVPQLRSDPFNTQPVGTGPFEWKFVEVDGTSLLDRSQHITLAAFNNYYNGRPKLDGFSLITYQDSQQLISAFQKKQINAMSGLEELPQQLVGDRSVQTYITPLTTSVMAFYNNSQSILSDTNVRRALSLGVDRSQLTNLMPGPVQLVNSPLLKGQLGYDPDLAEPNYDPVAAAQTLDQAGWVLNSSGQREKNGTVLSLNLSSQDSLTYSKVAVFLQQQWAKLGVKVNVQYFTADDLQASVVGNHSYDILLYGINIGVDPDVFAYWDSSQASLTSQGHLNLSEYKSTAADAALEAGRTRSDPAVRSAKYHEFLSAWTTDNPALGLYQQNYLYITRGPVFNYERSAANSGVDRFYNVDQWMIRQKRQNLN